MTRAFAVVCEDEADRVTAAALADRVLCLACDWLTPADYWRYGGLEPGHAFLKWSPLKGTAAARRVRFQGFFREDEPALPDSRAAMRALLLFARADPPPDAVLLIRDADRQPERLDGLKQARDELSWPFPVVIGFCVPKREAWHLAGFVPADDNEADRLAVIRRQVGFDPSLDSHRLTASHDWKNDKLSAKRVLNTLTGADPDREQACLAVDLARLRANGANNGLADYLDDVAARLLPLFAPRPPG